MTKTLVMRLLLATVALSWQGAWAGDAPSSGFTPEAGFTGRSEGNGTLRLGWGRLRPFHVTSLGTRQSDGSFRLEQTVSFQGEPTRSRVWRLRETGPRRYTGTLTDAAGAVTGTTAGSHLRLHYRLKGPLVMHQDLELTQGGRVIDNIGVIRLFGIPVGRLQETIER